jgi:hypothetical protein
MLLKNVLLVANLEDGAGCKDWIRVASKLRSPESLDPERVQASNWFTNPRFTVEVIDESDTNGDHNKQKRVCAPCWKFANGIAEASYLRHIGEIRNPDEKRKHIEQLNPHFLVLKLIFWPG